MNYYIKVSLGTHTKNRLQAALQTSLFEFDRTIIYGEEELEKNKDAILEKIDELNKVHSTCRPEVRYWANSLDSRDKYLQLGFVGVRIYQAIN